MIDLALSIVISLTRFACVSPDYVEVMLHYHALEKVLSFVRDMVVGTRLMDNLAKFVAVVCRAKAKILLETENTSTLCDEDSTDFSSVSSLSFKGTLGSCWFLKHAYHKTCFKCSHGGCHITTSTYAPLKGILYCKHHFSRFFKEKDSYNTVRLLL